jgi:hypothetical protein
VKGAGWAMTKDSRGFLLLLLLLFTNHLEAIEQALGKEWAVHVIDDEYSKDAEYSF